MTATMSEPELPQELPGRLENGKSEGAPIAGSVHVRIPDYESDTPSRPNALPTAVMPAVSAKAKLKIISSAPAAM